MKLFDVISSANSNLLRNKGRSLLTILAVFIGCFTIIMTTGINTGVSSYIDRQVESAGGEGHLDIIPAGMMDMMPGMSLGSGEVQEYNPDQSSATMQTISSEDIAEIESIRGIQSARVFNMVEVEYIESLENDKKFIINVAELPTETINIDLAAGRQVDTNSNRLEITLDYNYPEALGYSNVGDVLEQTVRLGVRNVVTGEITKIEAYVVGVQNASVVSMGRSWVNPALNDRLHNTIMAGMPEQYKDRAFFATAQIHSDYLSDEEVKRIVGEIEELGLTAMTIEDQAGMIKAFFDAITMVLTIFGVIALLAASIGIINTLFMAVQERTREIGLMKAMGLSKRKIYSMFSIEAVALGFWGSTLGVAMAFAAREVANHVSGQTFLSGLPGFTLVEFNPSTLITIVLIVMFIAFLAGSLPARRASKKDPIEALRYE